MNITGLGIAEAPTEGHPDLLADIIADSILDACLQNDAGAKVACEVLVAKHLVVIAGEFSCKNQPDIVSVARRAIRETGYVSPEQGLSADDCEMRLSISEQSLNLQKAVDRALGRSIGSGDQSGVTGYAENNETGMIPSEMWYARLLANALTHIRKTRQLAYLWPDGKVLVVLEGAEGHPVVRTFMHLHTALPRY